MPRLQTTVLTLFKQNSGIIFEESPMKHIPPMHSMKAGSFPLSGNHPSPNNRTALAVVASSTSAVVISRISAIRFAI